MRCQQCIKKFSLTALILCQETRFSSGWIYPSLQHGLSRSLEVSLTTFSNRLISVKPPETRDVITQKKKLLRVVTDIDDTVKSSGNKRLAGIPLGGIDAQYERGQFYPGVFQFALELASHSTPQDRSPLPVAVLTARAKEFLFALELKHEHPVSIGYRQCGIENGYDGWGLGPVLYGSVKEWICWTRKSKRKFKNFKRLMEQDLKESHFTGYDTDYIFIGDTGEGDTKAGVKMCESFPGELKAMFLHSVSCDEEYCISPEDYSINEVPIFFFKTYIGAAAKAFGAGLVSKDGVERVVQRAVEDLELSGAPKTSSKWEDLQADIELAIESIAQRNAAVPKRLVEVAKFLELQQ